MSMIKIPLPKPTNRTKAGPRFRGDDQRAVIEYDFQENDGSTLWSSIEFEEPMKIEFRQIACCIAEDVVSAGDVVSVDDSALYLETIARWQKSVGWQEWQKKNDGSRRFRHFKIFFDDVGCFDIVAATCIPLPRLSD